MKKHNVIILILSVILAIETILSVCMFIRRPKKASLPAHPAVSKGRIAIVLDDWGYNTHNLVMLDGIKYRLTFSVLPGLRYSAFLSRELNRRGFEVILHLPMEPHEAYNLEKDTVLASMDDGRIRSIVDADLNGLAGVKGVSNHMGSRATEDYRVMSGVFRELKKRHLYFLDSFVSSASVCRRAAADTGISFAERDVFLDNEENPAYIRAQLMHLANRARAQGYAVGIGHDRRNTIKVLKEMMPQLAQEGFRFVFVSEVAR
ncbi:MAG: divergent polysaccharide deacetylase family protein [Candidatus Omnitrophota bacterium]